VPVTETIARRKTIIGGRTNLRGPNAKLTLRKLSKFKLRRTHAVSGPRHR
jgi:hypothetical protein